MTKASFVYLLVSFNILAFLELPMGVTIHEIEEDDFRSEFYRNSNHKGFKDSKSKHQTPEVVGANV